MVHGLEQPHQQIGEHDHRQRQSHQADIGGKLLRLRRRPRPQGVHPGGKGGGNPTGGYQHTDAHRNGDQIAGGPQSLLPAALEAGSQNGHRRHAQRVRHSGEEIDGVIVGGGIQVRRYLGAEGPGLQGLPDDPQQLGQQRHQGHRADESDCLISFHFFRSMMPRISSSF